MEVEEEQEQEARPVGTPACQPSGTSGFGVAGGRADRLVAATIAEMPVTRIQSVAEQENRTGIRL